MPRSICESRQLNGRAYRFSCDHNVSEIQERIGLGSSRLMVAVRGGTSVPLEVCDENWFDRLAKAVGVAREHQTGDVAFDRRFYVRCLSPDFARRMFENPAARKAVADLRDLGFRVIRFTGSDVEAEGSRFEGHPRDYGTISQDAAGHLLQLADARFTYPRPKDARAILESFPSSTLMTLTVLLAVLGFVLYGIYPPVRFLSVTGLWLIALACLLVSYASISGFLVRGESVSHDAWKWLLACGAVFLPLSSLGLVAVLNGWCDPGARSVHELTVTDKSMQTGGRGGTSCVVEVPDWRDPRETMTFGIDRSEFGQIEPGKTRLEVTTYPGGLGVEWRKGHRLLF
jgi:hypothetical protein